MSPEEEDRAYALIGALKVRADDRLDEVERHAVLT